MPLCRWFLFAAGLVVCLTGLLPAPGPSLAADTAKPTSASLTPFWPQWRGPARDDISPDQGLLKDWNQKAPKLLWTAE